MDKVLEQTKQTIEVPVELPVQPVESSGGFPWCGAGIVVVIVAAAVIGRRILKK